jgi:hypothetical protein
LLGGYYAITQLGEVYGVDEEKYASLSPWFTVDASLIERIPINTMSVDSLKSHPYISGRQAYTIDRMRKRHVHFSGWENFDLLDEFTATDRDRLLPYLSFE